MEEEVSIGSNDHKEKRRNIKISKEVKQRRLNNWQNKSRGNFSNRTY